MNTNFYRLLALAYLVPVAIMHVASNTVAVGFEADVASIMFGATIAMMAFTALPWIGEIIGVSAVKAAPIEWLFNGLLVAFCAITFFQMHSMNVTSTGFSSLFALVWEWVSVIIGVVAFIAFWAVKGDQIKGSLAAESSASNNRNA